ncbi:MAG TPA: TetR family transcriptional regulator [Trebonia sp.]|nr:TetR family transcriptional regulator [Trebonia sp.]
MPGVAQQLPLDAECPGRASGELGRERPGPVAQFFGRDDLRMPADADATSGAGVNPSSSRIPDVTRSQAWPPRQTGRLCGGVPPTQTSNSGYSPPLLTVYGGVGWAGFTLDWVARRTPVGKAALYRRWPSKENLLLAALEHLAEPAPDDFDPTNLRSCLIGMTAQVIDMFIGPKALVLPRVLIEAAQCPPHFDDTSSRPPPGAANSPREFRQTSSSTPSWAG